MLDVTTDYLLCRNPSQSNTSIDTDKIETYQESIVDQVNLIKDALKKNNIYERRDNMKKYLKAAITTMNPYHVKTPYGEYDFETESDAQEFLDFVESDPDYYDDPDMGDLIEWIFFYKKNEGTL